MATFNDAIKAKLFELVPLPLWELRLPIRNLYGTPDFLDWIEECPELHSDGNKIGGRTLYEHIWQLMADFRCAQRPGPGDLHIVMPPQKRVWKMHPIGMRLFGWVPAKHTFAIVKGVTSEISHQKGMTKLLREEVIAFAKKHHLTETMAKGGYLENFPHE